MTVQASAKVLVSTEIAASFPSRPDHVRECASQAEASMRKLASERRRHLAGPPELVEIRDTGLDIVELTFVVDTESD